MWLMGTQYFAAAIAVEVANIRPAVRLFRRAGRRSSGMSTLALATLAGAQILAGTLGTPVLNAAAQSTQQSSSESIQILAREQSTAEQYAVILDRLGRNDITRYLQGITRYADAKADFDGLIEALKTDLIEGRNPSGSPNLGKAVRTAAERRIAFTSFVADQVVGDKESAKGALPAVIGVVPDLVKALTEAGIGIWKEYVTAGKESRDAIRDQLDHLKWKPFADLAKT
jgi:hypothetical protein